MLTRLTGIAVLLMAAIAWPMAALAADSAVVTQQNPAVVYIVLMLLFAALTVALFFASPLRGRLLPSTAEPKRRSRPNSPAQLDEASIYPGQFAPPAPAPMPQTQSPYPPAPVNPTTSPWSTGAPQPTEQWGHHRRDPGADQS